MASPMPAVFGTMTTISADEPFFVLVDDHIHSARLMRRAVREAAHLAQFAWIGNARRAERTLARLFDQRGALRPDLVIVDLKSSSDATARFIGGVWNRLNAAGVPIVALSDRPDGDRQTLMESGADAVFERHHDLDAYRAEIADIVSFWVRETVTWPIRA